MRVSFRVRDVLLQCVTFQVFSGHEKMLFVEVCRTLAGFISSAGFIYPVRDMLFQSGVRKGFV